MIIRKSRYSNSTLNIAAAAVPNGEFGCFSTRNPGRVYGCKVVAQTESESSNTSVWDITIQDLSLNIKKGVLRTRGWVVQEIFLAPRTLHFATQQLFWECTSTTACETFPDSFFMGEISTSAIKTKRWDHPDLGITKKWGSVVENTVAQASLSTRTNLSRCLALHGSLLLNSIRRIWLECGKKIPYANGLVRRRAIQY